MICGLEAYEPSGQSDQHKAVCMGWKVFLGWLWLGLVTLGLHLRVGLAGDCWQGPQMGQVGVLGLV